MKIVIAGAGEVGSHLARMLVAGANEVTVIDSDEKRLQSLSSIADIVAVEGNPSSIHTLKEAGAGSADLFISVYPSQTQDVNIVASLLAKKLGSKKVTARVNNDEFMSYDTRYLFTEMGIDLLFYPEMIAADEIYDLLDRTSANEMLDFARGQLQMVTIKLDEESPAVDMTLLEFVENSECPKNEFRVVAISRGDSTLLPKADTRFKFGDMLFIIATRDSIEPLLKSVGKTNFNIDSVMIVGGSPIAVILAKRLCKKIDKIKIIEKDRERCFELSESLPSKVQIINGDGRNSELLIEEGISSFGAFVALTDSSETNILSCVAAKKMGVRRTIAQVENLEYISLAEGMGVDAVINKKLITAGRIFKFTLSDKVRFVKYMSGTNAEIIEFIVAPGSWITKAPLKDLNFPRQAIIGGVIRGGNAFIAVGDTQIQAYDRVAVFAMPDCAAEVDKWFK